MVPHGFSDEPGVRKASQDGDRRERASPVTYTWGLAEGE
jgi:hypothetical protein